MKPRTTPVIVLLPLWIFSIQPVAAEISKQERKAAKAMFSSDLYLRVDAPCTKGRHPYGVFLSPLIEASPRGVNTQVDEGASFGWFHAASTVWDVRVNDPVRLDELDWEADEASVEIELEGVGPADGRDTVVRFVGISSLADFQATFDHVFSPRPLQDDHPDWPAEIREAIRDRRLLDGMNKRQAYYVVGMPARVEEKTEDGKQVEIWTLQRENLRIGFFGVRAGDAGTPPELLRFEDGVLVSAATAPSALNLDD